MQNSQAAYLAGFFDGEGSVYAASRGGKNRRPSPTLLVCIGNTNYEVLLFHKELFGGSLHRRIKKERWQPQWQWVLCAKMAEPYLRAIAPYLIIKKKVVLEGIKYIELMKTPRRERLDYSSRGTVRPEFRAETLKLHARIRRLNAHSGPYNALRGRNPWEAATL